MLEPSPSWFHGGVPGLKPGDLILPPARTGILTLADVMKRYGDSTSRAAVTRRKDSPALVYINSYPAEARVYAAFWTICPWYPGDGYVYRVDPAGLPAGVPGFLGEAVCPEAVVREVVTPSGVDRAAALAIDVIRRNEPRLRDQYRWLQRDGVIPPSGRVVMSAP